MGQPYFEIGNLEIDLIRMQLQFGAKISSYEIIDLDVGRDELDPGQ